MRTIHRSFRNLAALVAAMLMLGTLAACQSAGTGVSTYNGYALKSSTKAGSKVRAAKRKTAKRRTAKRRAVKRRVSKRRSRRAQRRTVAKMPPEKINKLIAKHAKANGVPVKLARAVVQVESNYNPAARGAVGEVGLMQLRPRTARGIGYKGSMKKLHNPDTNLKYGMKYLGEAYRRGGKTTCGAILKYNAGHYAKRMNKTSARYCKKVKTILKSG